MTETKRRPRILTGPDRAIFDFVKGYIAERGGASPSFQEIADAVGYASRGTIHRRLGYLEDAGLIRRLHDRWRAIEIVGDEAVPVAPRNVMHTRFDKPPTRRPVAWCRDPDNPSAMLRFLEDLKDRSPKPGDAGMGA